jgi:hypothetical protein
MGENPSVMQRRSSATTVIQSLPYVLLHIDIVFKHGLQLVRTVMSAAFLEHVKGNHKRYPNVDCLHSGNLLIEWASVKDPSSGNHEPSPMKL